MFDAATVARFMDKVIPVTESGCWLWTGAETTQGYGGFFHAGSKHKTHRLAWQMFRGPIPAMDGYHGACVCHKCDTRLCVNPDHLFIAPQSVNNADRARKGRGRAPTGADHPFRKDPSLYLRGSQKALAKLTEADVLAIRSDARQGIVIAAEYGVCPSLISGIRNRRTWRHV